MNNLYKKIQICFCIIMWISIIFIFVNLFNKQYVISGVFIITTIISYVFYNFIDKYLIQKHDSEKIITIGKRGADGFADTYIDGVKTNNKILLWDRADVEKLQQIGSNIHKRMYRKQKINKLLNND